ncbi:hypothetical protein CRENBAI_017398 [Crenichthys baileyi]|uniref:Uncharacterized protein n=1 Tax=Crenichthys baileyi TaxID=28760 RepID=A0AAV9RQY2_9TELE
MVTPPQVSFIPDKPTKQHPHSASSTHSPAPSPPAHRRNRADTVERRAHNGAPNPTPRRHKLTWQEVHCQQQALGAGVPHHTPATTQTHHITATTTLAQPAASSPSVRERDTCTSWVSQTKPQCTHKTCSTAPPTRPPSIVLPPARGKSHRRKHWSNATTARQGPGTPPTPHSNPGGAPGCRPPTLPHSTPGRTKQAGQPLHQSEATSQSTQHTARPRPPHRSPAPPQPADQALKPGTEIQGNPNDPERAEKPAPAPDNPQDPNSNPSPDPGLRPQTTNSKRGCEKTTSLPSPAQMWC